MKLAAFVIGGAFAGLAGVLYAMLFGIVPLESIGFVFSGNVVFATLIGGSGSLYGPVIGSFVFIWLSESVSVDVGALAAPAGRGLRDRGAVLPGRGGRGVGALLGVAGRAARALAATGRWRSLGPSA